MNVYHEIGPAHPPAWLLHQRAREIESMARRAADLAREGPAQNVPAALRAFAQIHQLTTQGEHNDG